MLLLLSIIVNNVQILDNYVIIVNNVQILDNYVIITITGLIPLLVDY